MIRTKDEIWLNTQAVSGIMEEAWRPPWIDEADLNCGAMLQEFDRDRASRNRFKAMQSKEKKAEISDDQRD